MLPRVSALHYWAVFATIWSVRVENVRAQIWYCGLLDENGSFAKDRAPWQALLSDATGEYSRLALEAGDEWDPNGLEWTFQCYIHEVLVHERQA
jgi:hypothetical protein